MEVWLNFDLEDSNILHCSCRQEPLLHFLDSTFRQCSFYSLTVHLVRSHPGSIPWGKADTGRSQRGSSYPRGRGFLWCCLWGWGCQPEARSSNLKKNEFKSFQSGERRISHHKEHFGPATQSPFCSSAMGNKLVEMHLSRFSLIL